MIGRIETIIWLRLDEDEQSEFLVDPSEAQKKVRALRSNRGEAPGLSADMPHLALRSGDEGHSKPAMAKGQPAPKARRATVPAERTKRTIPKQTCSLCAAKGIDKQLPAHWMARHLKKEHGVDAAPAATEN